MLDRLLAAAVPSVASAAVALVAIDGEPAAVSAVGELIRYADATETLLGDRPPVAVDSVFDLASLTKLFTTVVAMSLVETGLLGLDEPVATWLPSYYGDRPSITLRHLLTHTSGLPPGRRPDGIAPESRWDFVLSAPVTGPPGPYVYSDVGMITVGRICEIVSGTPLDALVERVVTGPLGLTDTTYRPGAGLLPRIAATEFKPERTVVDGGPSGVIGQEAAEGGASCDRVRVGVDGREIAHVADDGGAARGRGLTGGGVDGGRSDEIAYEADGGGAACDRELTGSLLGVVVRGEVHDETAHALGGVAGHAGLFATAGDLLRFAEILRTGGAGVLSAESVAEMTRDQGVAGASFRQGLGFRIGDPAIVGPLADAHGHSGFTGTSLVVDLERGLTVILLTNNVHPLRGRPGIRDLRNAVAAFARSLV
ncbi:serine hydrolase domain-containing protein [Herbidospora daliensis]|uniref:serine hydrolase domain-containing protein n=1 Tax=Herbidospora daliensis TaxID=295585 RepID=UPI0007843AEC|nr:serine hydrolase domain-containing protein [Herbidospora daliensis]